jgi:tRNA(Ile)-lysidine synthase
LNLGFLLSGMSFTFKTPASLRNFPIDRPYLVGVSGGRDSVVLLHQLVEMGYGKLRVCHLNHQLRGRSSDADARFVRKLAEQYGLRSEIGSSDVRALAARKGESIELAAREARYRFFAQVARRRRCSTIFLAHHADDLVETLLINLFRGTGLAGLAGMREVSERTISGLRMTIVRPLLAIWRSDIDACVKNRKLEYRDDATNRDLEPLRNRIRLRALPYLERTLGRNIKMSLWRTAQIAAEEEGLLESLLPALADIEDSLDLKPLRTTGLALQRRTLREWLRKQGVSNIGFEVVERVRALVDVESGPAKTNLPGDKHARRRAGKLFIE